MSDLNREDVAELLGEERQQLIRAMVDSNQPLQRGLDAVNAHLKELNGKVAQHSVALAKGGERMDGFKDDIARLERRHERRRKNDPEPSGENRRITMRDLYVAIGSISVIVAILKFLGKL